MNDPVAAASHSVLARAVRAQALPFAEVEGRSVAGAFLASSELLLGDRATEGRAKTLGDSVRYVHFATHGLLDRRSPLDSGIVLAAARSKDDGDNGVLQAWEIFERLRLHADLVTLSGCETGLGRDAGGEGLIGLVRALHYAGAHSVAASLWPVADRSTAELMKVFYENLAAEKPKDESLQAAQSALRRGPFAHPFHWAGFAVYGDWK